MASSYGAEATQGERYRLSFTVGGLLASQGRALAEMYLESSESCRRRRRWCSSQTEVGKSIAAIRQQAVEENVLAIRTDSANRRVVAETTRRLSALTVGELAYLAGPDSSTSDREALMWIAMCRYYAIVGEFAGEVLKKHYLTGNTHLDFEGLRSVHCGQSHMASRQAGNHKRGNGEKNSGPICSRPWLRPICSIKIPTRWFPFPVPLWRIFLEENGFVRVFFRCANHPYEQNGG